MSSQRTSEESSSEESYDYDPIKEECDDFIEIVKHIFEVSKDSSIYSVVPDIVLDYDNTHVNIDIGNKNTGKKCASIQYGHRTILIHEISKCGNAETEQGAGTDIIKRIIAVGYELKEYFHGKGHVNIIIDSDQSKINVGGIQFELNWLYLFSTGETWYNHLGFKEEDYHKISECIEPLITPEIKRKFKQIMHDIKQISKHAIIDAHALKQLHDYKEVLKNQKELFLSEVECNIHHKFRDISYDLYEVKGGNNKKKKTIRRTRKQKNKKKTKKTKTKKTKTKKTKNKKTKRV
jgi:hypothetical protein